MKKAERALRQDIIDQCRHMNAVGLNQGTSGNISVRDGSKMLITPSATPYDDMTPEMIAVVALDGGGAWEGPKRPSSEWRFHLDILNARPDVNAVVHTHAPNCTALAIALLLLRTRLGYLLHHRWFLSSRKFVFRNIDSL